MGSLSTLDSGLRRNDGWVLTVDHLRHNHLETVVAGCSDTRRHPRGRRQMHGCAALIACVVLLALTACGGPSAPASAPTDTPTLTPAVSAGSKQESTKAPTSTPSPGPSRTSPSEELEGGLLATFRVDEERFHVWVTNPYSVHIILRVHGGTSTSFVPNGRIRPGPGQGSHNAPWSWHLDAEDTGMDHFALGECDAAPSQVEHSLAHFLDVVKRFCPSGADLVRVEYFPPGK